MKVLFIGDIYGKPGLDILSEKLPELKATYKPHLIIVNAENAHYGRGITQKIYKELMNLGVHMITMGNWVWGQRELYDFIDQANIVRPFNFREAPGKGYITINFNGQKILIINALGRTFMNPQVLCPFVGVENILKENPADYSILDFHAEATSEKVAIGHYLDGKISAVIGTHTHVQTADETTLPGGTLYITDVGMTGPRDGIIGVSKEIVLNRFLNGFSTPNEVAPGAKQLNGVIMDLKMKTIERIHLESETV
ncbi:MAG: TIGR00282 family metallophosphoesterase [Acholeplasmataceae bacterium]|jgi:metallophosphoesterase (TIGR00282 family)|nr:TIGR00282 family metallophosphoesterase [Acholeplasmataceae bacterium]